MHRTLVIGDIHGGLKALEQVFQRASVTKADKLIFLGDYVDGWSESAQVIDYLIYLSSSQECIFLRGNHDIWCEEWLLNHHAGTEWLSHGGKATVMSYLRIDPSVKREHLEFFQHLKWYATDDQNRLFVHAGFTSLSGPAGESDLTNFCWDRSLWETALMTNKNITRDSPLYPKQLKLFREIFIGHTPTINYTVKIPMRACNIWNIDTGAAFSGRLTVMDIDTKAYWQSDSVKTFYPNENGRN
jgi:serine/threonine protein phosphatase 1